MLSSRVVVLLCVTLLLAACASDGYTYLAPAGISQQMLDADRNACDEESGIVRLGDDQRTLAQQCMMQRGYTMKKTP
jgi:hypothetical protein